jgi:hypothetical protein
MRLMCLDFFYSLVVIKVRPNAVADGANSTGQLTDQPLKIIGL